MEALLRRELTNPRRVRRLIEDAVASQGLDLRGIRMLTEVGSGAYLVTPVIAALGGAEQVFALTGDSVYGRAEDVADNACRFAKFCGVADRVRVVFSKSPDVVGSADIVTNLGFVRPIDARTVGMMKRGAVVPLMCEAWEFRPGDVDLDACRAKGIIVVATNEDCPGLEVFDFVGPLCVKLLFEAEIEVYKARIAVASADKFGRVIEKFLAAMGADVRRFATLAAPEAREFLAGADAVVVVDYRSTEVFIGAGGQIEVQALQVLAPGITVISFAGLVDAEALEAAGIPWVPRWRPQPTRMARTLAYLGPRPVIDLHCAGLKVAERAVRAAARGASVQEVAHILEPIGGLVGSADCAGGQ